MKISDYLDVKNSPFSDYLPVFTIRLLIDAGIKNFEELLEADPAYLQSFDGFKTRQLNQCIEACTFYQQTQKGV